MRTRKDPPYVPKTAPVRVGHPREKRRFLVAAPWKFPPKQKRLGWGTRVRNADPGLICVDFQEGEDDDAGDGDIKPDWEGEAGHAAVHSEAAAEREEKGD